MYCHKERADHNWVDGKWQCPHPIQESGYGYFHGGDPRNFHPDCECCSSAEIENHKKACDEASRLESEGKPIDWENPSGWASVGDVQVHILRAPFGIGTYTWEEQTEFELLDEGDCRDIAQ
jgi:hypothetical protein